MMDYGARPEPGLLVRSASYLALITFFAFLSGASMSMRSCAMDDGLDRLPDDSELKLTSEQRYELARERAAGRFRFGAAIGAGTGVVFLIGYHFEHGLSHLRTRERP